MERRTPCAPGARGITALVTRDNYTHGIEVQHPDKKFVVSKRFSKRMDVEWGFKALRDQLCTSSKI